MKQPILYRPFRYYKVFFYVMMVMQALFFYGAGQSASDISAACFCAAMGVAIGCFAMYFYDQSNVVLGLERDGIQIMNCAKKECAKVLWEEFRYAYYSSNYKGQWFIVLSTETLTTQEVRRIMNRAANGTRICVDQFSVVPLDPLLRPEKREEITAWIDRHVARVDIGV